MREARKIEVLEFTSFMKAVMYFTSCNYFCSQFFYFYTIASVYSILKHSSPEPGLPKLNAHV
jgi:hypothetical protein